MVGDWVKRDRGNELVGQAQLDCFVCRKDLRFSPQVWREPQLPDQAADFAVNLLTRLGSQGGIAWV